MKHTEPKPTLNITSTASASEQQYDQDYFMHGVTSCYNNFHYMRELGITRANAFIKATNAKKDSKILDYGCGMGPITAALTTDLGYDAIGVDGSEWAAANCLAQAKGHVFSLKECPLEKFADKTFDVTIAKDVFEHIPLEQLHHVVDELMRISSKVIFLVPFCDANGHFICAEDEKDTSHITRLTKEAWLAEFPYKTTEHTEVAKIVKGAKAYGSFCAVMVN
jgi:cyclopropane fatty-acyl-phospholipid synthase-like methyltransferase